MNKKKGWEENPDIVVDTHGAQPNRKKKK